jgi:hypothetical protein
MNMAGSFDAAGLARRRRRMLPVLLPIYTGNLKLAIFFQRSARPACGQIIGKTILEIHCQF